MSPVFSSITRTQNELSIVCQEDVVPAGDRSELQWRGLQIVGPLSFSSHWHPVSVTAPSAAAGIPVFVISTYNTDYIFVRALNFDRALEVLRSEGYELTATTNHLRSEGADVGLADENDSCGS